MLSHSYHRRCWVLLAPTKLADSRTLLPASHAATPEGFDRIIRGRPFRLLNCFIFYFHSSSSFFCAQIVSTSRSYTLSRCTPFEEQYEPFAHEIAFIELVVPSNRGSKLSRLAEVKGVKVGAITRADRLTAGGGS